MDSIVPVTENEVCGLRGAVPEAEPHELAADRQSMARSTKSESLPTTSIPRSTAYRQTSVSGFPPKPTSRTLSESA